ncbi:HvfC/BufC N-terminal domain-containing protein [Cupriavidus necator]
MHLRPPTLLELQRAVGHGLLHEAGGDMLALVAEDGLAPQARLGIYRNTAIATLVTALRLSYPAIHALVGPEFFEGAARLFMEESPPRSAWLDRYGEGFPEFLAGMPQAASLTYLPDTARLEWAVNTVLHAPDAMPLDLARLAHQEEAKQEDVCFTPHPAVRLLQSDFPIDAIWRAVLSRDEGAMEAIDLSAGPVWLLVHRTPSGVEVDRLSAWQWRFAAALFAGRPLHAALQEAPSSETHAWLATLLASGCFTAISLSGRPLD